MFRPTPVDLRPFDVPVPPRAAPAPDLAVLAARVRAAGKVAAAPAAPSGPAPRPRAVPAPPQNVHVTVQAPAPAAVPEPRVLVHREVRPVRIPVPVLVPRFRAVPVPKVTARALKRALLWTVLALAVLAVIGALVGPKPAAGSNATGAAVTPSGGVSTVAAADGPAAAATGGLDEDQPGWDCRRDGNGSCGLVPPRSALVSGSGELQAASPAAADRLAARYPGADVYSVPADRLGAVTVPSQVVWASADGSAVGVRYCVPDAATCRPRP